MITITKQWAWFLVSWKKINWGIESTDIKCDFCTHSNNDKIKCKWMMCINWPWEFEKNEAEIKWIEINNEWAIAFNVFTEKTKIVYIPENIGEIRWDFFDELEECDLLIISLWQNSDIKTIKTLLENIEPRITVFWWDNTSIVTEKYPQCEKTDEIKINSLPVDTSLFYILI